MRLKKTEATRLRGKASKAARTDPKVRTSLVDALFSTTQQRVLALLFGQPERSFFANEIIALTKSGSGGVQKELRRLTDSGLVTTTRIGNQKHFQANHNAPLYQDLLIVSDDLTLEQVYSASP